MFKNILFATTASPTCDNAAKVAFDLQLKWDAKLTVFHVLGIPSRGYSPFVTDVRKLSSPSARRIPTDTSRVCAERFSLIPSIMLMSTTGMSAEKTATSTAWSAIPIRRPLNGR